MADFYKDGGIIGGSAALSYVLGGVALNRTNLSYAARGGVQAVVGTGLAIALKDYMPRVAIGLLAGGFVGGVQGLTDEVQLRRYLAQQGTTAALTGTSTSQLGAGTTGGTTGAGGSLVGSGYSNLYAMADR